MTMIALSLDVGHARNLGFRDEQQVDRRLGHDVSDRENVFVLKNDLARDFAGANAREERCHKAKYAASRNALQ
jgi:hypothetical protein